MDARLKPYVGSFDVHAAHPEPKRKRRLFCGKCSRTRCGCYHDTPRALTKQTCLPHGLYSEQDSIALQLFPHFSTLNPHSDWIALVPCRLQDGPGACYASLAVSDAMAFHNGDRSNMATAILARQKYVRAVRWLRNTLSGSHRFSEDALICVALLTMFELVMNPWSASRQKDVYAHWSGLCAMILSMPAGADTDIVQSILYNSWECGYGIAIARGTPSPFDDPQWQKILARTSSSLQRNDLRQLRQLAPQMLSKIPGLIADLRQIRTDRADSIAITRACLYAKELSLLKDEISESDMLHCVRIVPTTGAELHRIVNNSFRFQAIEDFNAFIMYSNARLATLDVCLKAAELFAPLPGVDVGALRTEKARLAVHVLMSWEYAMSVGPFATLWTTQAMMPIWTLVRSTERFRNVPSAVVQAWLLAKLNHPLNGWLSGDVSADQMDTAGDMLVGGPMAGFIAETGSNTKVYQREASVG